MKKGFKRLAMTCIVACTFVSIATVGSACDGFRHFLPNETPIESSASADTYTITYDTGVPGLTIPPTIGEKGSKITPPEVPVRDGYRFKGWYLNGREYSFGVMPGLDITLKAEWGKGYCISFDVGESGDLIEPLELAEGEKISFPEAPGREGYEFDGWLMDGKPFALEVMPSEDITLTAAWAKLYTIRFDVGNVNTTVEPIVAKSGAAIAAPDADCPGYHLRRWTLNGKEYSFKNMPEEDITLTAEWVTLTNLPSMFIDLYDASGKVFPLGSVDKTEYVDSKITLTNTDKQFKLTNVKSSFKGRGNGSWACAKKGYKIKFNKKQSLFGRESNKHWVIIACANFDDPTMSRNYLAYNMAGEVFSDIEYSTQAFWIDVYVNEEYRGVYLLCEHVRVGKGRVDIESEYGVEDTGYLVEYDAYATGREGIDYFRVPGLKYAFSMSSPDPEDYETEGKISEELYRKQVAYIKDYVTRVYDAALKKDFDTFASLVDVDSFVDMYILHELFKNVDTGYSSFYLYKKPGGLLYAGPPWDFDATTNINERGNRTPQGIYVADQVQSGSNFTASELYISLYRTEGFLKAVKARWKVLSPQIRGFLDERMNEDVYSSYKAAMGKNYALWYNKTQSRAETDWVAEMRKLKTWLTDRITWLDSEWK